jgi:hypothetical protein
MSRARTTRTSSAWIDQAAVKKAWGDRVTTGFVRQGKFAHDPKVVASYPPADLSVERMGDLLGDDLPALFAGHRA